MVLALLSHADPTARRVSRRSRSMCMSFAPLLPMTTRGYQGCRQGCGVLPPTSPLRIFFFPTLLSNLQPNYDSVFVPLPYLDALAQTYSSYTGICTVGRANGKNANSTTRYVCSKQQPLLTRAKKTQQAVAGTVKFYWSIPAMAQTRRVHCTPIHYP